MWIWHPFCYDPYRICSGKTQEVNQNPDIWVQRPKINLVSELPGQCLYIWWFLEIGVTSGKSERSSKSAHDARSLFCAISKRTIQCTNSFWPRYVRNIWRTLFTKYGLNVSLKWATRPRSGSRSRALPSIDLQNEAAPTSAFLSDGPCLSASNVVMPNQSSIKSSYSNQLDWPSNWGGITQIINFRLGFPI